MLESPLYYKHSGGVGPFALVMVPLLSALAALIFSIPYAYGVYYIPLIYIKFFLTLGFGFALGITVGWLGKLFKVRNMFFMSFIGLLAGAVGAYGMWVAWFFAVIQYETGVLGLILSPMALLEIMRGLAVEGVWSIKGSTPTGWALYSVWIVEAGMVILMSAAVAASYLNDRFFCERCERWMSPSEVFSNLEPLAGERWHAIVSDLERGEMGSLLAVQSVPMSAALRTEVALYRCPGCDNNHLLSAKLIQMTLDAQGKTSKTEHALAHGLILKREHHEALKGLALVQSQTVAAMQEASGPKS
jgi:hypothetical protein